MFNIPPFIIIGIQKSIFEEGLVNLYIRNEKPRQGDFQFFVEVDVEGGLGPLNEMFDIPHMVSPGQFGKPRPQTPGFNYPVQKVKLLKTLAPGSIGVSGNAQKAESRVVGPAPEVSIALEVVMGIFGKNNGKAGLPEIEPDGRFIIREPEADVFTMHHARGRYNGAREAKGGLSHTVKDTFTAECEVTPQKEFSMARGCQNASLYKWWQPPFPGTRRLPEKGLHR